MVLMLVITLGSVVWNLIYRQWARLVPMMLRKKCI